MLSCLRASQLPCRSGIRHLLWGLADLQDRDLSCQIDGRAVLGPGWGLDDLIAVIKCFIYGGNVGVPFLNWSPSAVADFVAFWPRFFMVSMLTLDVVTNRWGSGHRK